MPEPFFLRILFIYYLFDNCLAKEGDGERWNSPASYLGQIIFPAKVKAEMSVHKFLPLKHVYVNKSFFAVFDSSENLVPLHYGDQNCLFQHFKTSK